jgi:hypothetical protein
VTVLPPARAGRDSSVGIATRYGKDGPGIEYLIPVGSDTFCTTSERPWGPPSFLYVRYRVMPGNKEAGARP